MTDSNEFISREEFRDFREDTKSDNQAILATVREGFSQVNARLDIVNGRIYKHEGAIAANAAKIDAHEEFVRNGPSISKKGKAAIVTGGSVGILAVLYSLFEMIKAFAPIIARAFGG